MLCRCENLLATYPERLTTVIAAEGSSTNNRLRAVNYYVIKIFLYIIFNKLANFSKNMFSLHHYSVLCVDEKNNIFTPF